MPRQRRTPALTSLHPNEAGAVLNALLTAHPDLIPQAEELATGILAEAAWESVREDVTHALLSLPLEALNDRAGYHPGRGYTHECDAAAEVVEEALAPFLDDMARRLKLGMTRSAHQIAAGVLAGLHACDHEHDRDGLLGYAGDLDAYAYSVFKLLDKHRLPLPDELLDTACPGWSAPRRR
jgi:hypothetical protein